MGKYKLAAICGRFQPLHKGHIYMIQKALDVAENVVVYIGSADKSGTPKNPFTYYARRSMILAALGTYAGNLAGGNDKGSLMVAALEDRATISDDTSWGKYYLDRVKKDFDRYPDLLVSGSENIRSSWFTPEMLSGIDILSISRRGISKNISNISATAVREALLKDDVDTFQALVDRSLYTEYNSMRATILEVNKEWQTAF